MNTLKQVLALALLACSALAQTVWAQAPAYPSKIVRLIVPFPPGGGNEVVAEAGVAMMRNQHTGHGFGF